MENAETVGQAVHLAFAAVNGVVWTGIFLYALGLDRRLRRLEHEEREP